MEKEGILLLEDGTSFRGRSFGAEGEVLGETVFNTSLTGYQEILTDPSYAEQIVTMTCPQIGNTGVNTEDMESSRPFLGGFIVREYNPTPSSWRAEASLGSFLKENGIVALDEVDTRRLVLKIRGEGALRGIVSTVDLDEESLIKKVRAYPGLVGRDLVREVTTVGPYEWKEGLPYRFDYGSVTDQRSGSAGEMSDDRKPRVVVYDFGTKRNILRCLVRHGCEVSVVSATTSAEMVLGMDPDGVFLTNGPGDPAGVEGVKENILALMKADIPIFGVCLGHQILALAAGGKTFKLKFGHRGGNHPVQDIQTGRVQITSQNHGFAVEEGSLRATGFAVSHVNLNDGTVEGMEHRELSVFSVQYHPEASPGPHDASPLFVRFIKMMEGRGAAKE